MVAVDTHSKWLEVFCDAEYNCSKTIDMLSLMFPRNGIPEQIVSDNGPQPTGLNSGLPLTQRLCNFLVNLSQFSTFNYPSITNFIVHEEGGVYKV